MGGLEACFRKAKNPYCLVLGVDVPLVPAEELAALIRQSLHSDAKAVILSHGGHEEPLMGVYCTDLADAMLEEITERKGRSLCFSAEKWIRMLRKPGRGLVFFQY